MLAARVIVSAIWLGAVIANLFMGISAAPRRDARDTRS